jgi:hypothetical protein
MQDIEPYYNWRHLYMAEEDPRSPFYGNTYSEFEYSQTVYNFYLHPQWDFFGSKTLYLKILFADYDQQFAILEFIGEWNDAIENDIMTFRRNITDILQEQGIRFFILVAENVLNFHSSDDSYYADWREELDELGGLGPVVNMPDQSQYDFHQSHIDTYLHFLDRPNWRTYTPELFFESIDQEMQRLLD